MLKGTVQFSEAVADMVSKGKLVPLVVVFYEPETDSLECYFPLTMTEEEALAILRKYNCFPEGFSFT